MRQGHVLEGLSDPVEHALAIDQLPELFMRELHLEVVSRRHELGDPLVDPLDKR